MTAWLNEIVALNVKPNTMQTYQSVFNSRIIPYLGEVKIQEITPAMLDKWIRGLQKLGLSFSSISAAHALIHHVLDYAVYPAKLISSNPAVYIKVPKNAPRNVIKRYIITPEKFKSLIEKYPFGTPYYIPLMLLYHTGMRIGEVLGLSWSDIDFVAKKINLTRQIINVRRGGLYFTTLKTQSSKRYILIDDYLLGELARWQNQQAENEEQCADSYVYIYHEEDGHIIRQSKCLPISHADKVLLVCTRQNGNLILKGQFVRQLKSEEINAHSFRHTHATQLIESGVNAKGVAARLGHSNALITQNLYTHNTRKLQVETLAILDKTLQTST